MNMDALNNRAGGRCELCGGGDGLAAFAVDTESALICGDCRLPVASGAGLEGARWYCLQESIWSEVPAVQVLSYRLLHRMGGQAWAAELLEQAYLEEDVLAWAQRGLEAPEEAAVKTVDSNGTELADGDSVTLIKDLPVKGANFTAKRGTLVKNIRVGDDPTHIEGRVNKMSIMLKTSFLKRVAG